MTTFSLDRLFQDGLAVGLGNNDLGADMMAVVASYPSEVRRELSAAMVKVISEAQSEDVEFEQADGTAARPEQLDSALFRLRSGNITQKIVFLRVKDALVEATIPLVSLSLAAFSGDVKAIISGAQALTALWKNLIMLKRETDSSAIDTYETLVALRVASPATHEAPPTTAAIAARLPTLEPSAITSALKRLTELKLIGVARWGGEHGDMTNTGNAWETLL